jgi:hypothetical protein
MRPVAEFRNIIYAALLVFVVMMAPNGVWGGATKLVTRVRDRRSPEKLERNNG